MLHHSELAKLLESFLLRLSCAVDCFSADMLLLQPSQLPFCLPWFLTDGPRSNPGRAQSADPLFALSSATVRLVKHAVAPGPKPLQASSASKHLVPCLGSCSSPGYQCPPTTSWDAGAPLASRQAAIPQFHYHNKPLSPTLGRAPLLQCVVLEGGPPVRRIFTLL